MSGPTPSDKIVIALDFGGTKCMAAAVNSRREIVARQKEDTPFELDAGIQLLKQLVGKVSGDLQISAIGCSAGGPLDYRSGIVSPLHCPNWRDVPLREILEAEFSVPVTIDVDTNAAALAEYQFGGHNSDRLLYITLSTGMGGGFVVDGAIYRGGNGSHPEIGHQTIPYRLPIPGPIPCPCGANDCLEAIISGTAIQRIYKKSAEQLCAIEWDQVAYNLGQGLRNLAAIYAPSLIVLGGGVAIGGGARLLDGAIQVLNRELKIVPDPKVSLSNLGYDTALWGAYALATAG